MNALNVINPKGVFDKLIETFGVRKVIVALGVGGSLAIAGMTTVLIVYPDDPKPITENIIEKENV